ncbi:MAG: hypothetical protein J6U54_00230 [Clostridiales bacterium]|nr:hypothetical protein [Clostridiales bacterium]
MRYDNRSLLDLLDEGTAYGVYVSDEELKKNSDDLNRVFKELEIKAKVVKFYGGPGFSEYRVSFNDPDIYEIIESRIDEIRSSMNVSYLRIINERRYGFRLREMTIEMANKEVRPVKIKDFFNDFRFRVSSMTIPLGGGTNRNYVMNLCDNLLVGGSSSEEVSGFIDSTLLSLISSLAPSDLKLILAGSKICDLKVYEGLPHLAKPMIKTRAGFIKMLDWLSKEIDKRYEFYLENGTRSFIDLHRSARFTRRKMMPRILVVISDLKFYLGDGSDDVTGKLSKLIIRGKNAGVNFLIATTDLTDEVLVPELKDLIDSRVAFKVKDIDESKCILGLDTAIELIGKGDLIYSTPSDTYKVQGVEVSPEELLRVTECIREKKEELYQERPPLLRRKLEEAREDNMTR